MTFAGINYWAVLIAAVAGWMVGGIWYGVLGKRWLAALGKTEAEMKTGQGTVSFYAPFVFAFAAALLMAWILAGILGHLGPGQITLRSGAISAAFCWLGFVATTMLVNYSFARHKCSLLLIDGGHWLIALVVMGAIVGWMGVK
jgi:hypothetical protein